MALIQWDSSFSVNVRELDDQHGALIKLINELHDAMQAGKAKDLLNKIIVELVNYTVNHFSTEEKYFAQFGYTEAETHIAEHKKFIDEVASFKKEFDEGRLGLSIKVMNFLSDWLRNHIKGTDKKYGPFFNMKGLT